MIPASTPNLTFGHLGVARWAPPARGGSYGGGTDAPHQGVPVWGACGPLPRSVGPRVGGAYGPPPPDQGPPCGGGRTDPYGRAYGPPPTRVGPYGGGVRTPPINLLPY